MTKALFGFAASATLLVLAGEPACAQIVRTFVSGHGSDSNACSVAAPCRTFQHAHDVVGAGGEVVALDAAGYGSITINKSATITAIGIEASITSSNTNPNGIVINAGSTDVVAVRGLTILSGTSTGDGIAVESAQTVTIQDCVIRGFPLDGIGVGPSGNADVELRGVAADNNAQNGLNITPVGSGTVTVVATDSYFSGNTRGVLVSGQNSTGKIKVTLNITSSSNGNGISVVSNTGTAQPLVLVTGSKLVHNTGFGLFGGNGNGGAQVFVDQTQIYGNGSSGWSATAPAVVSSYKNNVVNGNANDNLNGVIQISTQ
jgi:hypothetical protein